MTIKNLGVTEWGGGRDMDLHRTYHVKFMLETDSYLDGPQIMTFASGLPLIGSPWTYGNDNDQYAVCTPLIECESVIKNETNIHWILKYTFTTKPWFYCLTTNLLDPVSQPDLISGSFVNYQERICKRRDGSAILSSSLEPIWIEKDRALPTVCIQQTRLNLELSMIAQMVNTLNDASLWELPKRCVKLRNVPWRRLVWGRCGFYYQRTLEFDIDYRTFDLNDVRDQGHRVVDDQLLDIDPDPDSWNDDPKNFIRLADGRGNPLKPALLDGHGLVCQEPESHKHYIASIDLYDESNFLQLGIPVVL